VNSIAPLSELVDVILPQGSAWIALNVANQSSLCNQIDPAAGSLREAICLAVRLARECQIFVTRHGFVGGIDGALNGSN
jgi:hypothetical protein